MSYLERAITDGHAKLTGEGKQQAVPAPNGGRAQAPDRTPSDRADLVVFRDDERKKPYAVIECKADGVTDAEFNQAVEQACGNGTVAQASAPAGCGSVPLPIHGRATARGGTPLEPAAGTAALRSNDIQPVSKEALITRSRNATRPFGRAASSRRRWLYQPDAMTPFSKNCGTQPISNKLIAE